MTRFEASGEWTSQSVKFLTKVWTHNKKLAQRDKNQVTLGSIFKKLFLIRKIIWRKKF